MAGLAAFAVLLSRCAGQECVQIGTGLANRGDPAAERLVGMTVGTVALAVDLSGDPTVRELLRRTRSTVLDAIANADVPFERVVDALGRAARQAARRWSRPSSRSTTHRGSRNAGPGSTCGSCRTVPKRHRQGRPQRDRRRPRRR